MNRFLNRFLAGLAAGAAAAGIAYAATGSSYWLWLAGSVAAISVWTWPLTAEALTDQT